MKFTQDEKNFMAMIGHSAERAVKCRDLPITPREARLLTASLREKGIPIVTGDNGYWIATKQAEIDRTVAVLRAKGIKTLAAAENLKACRIS